MTYGQLADSIAAMVADIPAPLRRFVLEQAMTKALNLPRGIFYYCQEGPQHIRPILLQNVPAVVEAEFGPHEGAKPKLDPELVGDPAWDPAATQAGPMRKIIARPIRTGRN
jgi:hypothetical protein